jgi:hypothetical protein
LHDSGGGDGGDGGGDDGSGGRSDVGSGGFGLEFDDGDDDADIEAETDAAGASPRRCAPLGGDRASGGGGGDETTTMPPHERPRRTSQQWETESPHFSAVLLPQGFGLAMAHSGGDGGDGGGATRAAQHVHHGEYVALSIVRVLHSIGHFVDLLILEAESEPSAVEAATPTTPTAEAAVAGASGPLRLLPPPLPQARCERLYCVRAAARSVGLDDAIDWGKLRLRVVARGAADGELARVVSTRLEAAEALRSWGAVVRARVLRLRVGRMVMRSRSRSTTSPKELRILNGSSLRLKRPRRARGRAHRGRPRASHSAGTTTRHLPTPNLPSCHSKLQRDRVGCEQIRDCVLAALAVFKVERMTTPGPTFHQVRLEEAATSKAPGTRRRRP